MTAEVAVLNKSAVALAADSKVTIGSGGSEKTYDSVNKIFTLSKRHPIGCMIYGNADFMLYPWETIIKLYRAELADRSKPSVELYAKSFIQFLKRFHKFKQVDIQANVLSMLRSVFSEVEKRVIYEAEVEGAAHPSAEYDAIYLRRVERMAASVANLGGWLSKPSARAVLARYSKTIGQVVAECVPNRKNNKIVDASIKLAAGALIYRYFSPQMAGLVIAGFGEDELFPSVYSFETDGYIGSQIKISKGDLTTVSVNNQSCVAAFAQNDIAYRFMEGIDPGYSNFIQGLIRDSLTKTNLKVFEKWAPKNKQTAKIKAEIAKLSDDAFKNILDMAREAIVNWNFQVRLQT